MTVKETAKEIERKYNIEINKFDEVERLREEVDIIKEQIKTLDSVLTNVNKIIEYLEEKHESYRII